MWGSVLSSRPTSAPLSFPYATALVVFTISSLRAVGGVGNGDIVINLAVAYM